jgi:plasmid stability protein
MLDIESNPQQETKTTMNAEVKIPGSRTADKFVVRLPDGMRQKIADVAKNYHRSMNSEIVSRLEQSLHSELLFGTEEAPDDEGQERITTDLNQIESAIIQRLRQLPAGKQKALLDLLGDTV